MIADHGLSLPFKLGSLFRPCLATRPKRAATRTSSSVIFLLPCLFYIAGAYETRRMDGSGMRSNGFLPDGLVQWSLLGRSVARNFLGMNDPCLQRMTLSLGRGARSALQAMIRSLWLPVAQAPHLKPFFMEFITGRPPFSPFHIPSCSSSAPQRYVFHAILQVLFPYLGRSCLRLFLLSAYSYWSDSQSNQVCWRCTVH